MKYRTMTPMGGTGSTFEAVDDAEALALATEAGYTVLDIQEAMNGDFILVIPDD